MRTRRPRTSEPNVPGASSNHCFVANHDFAVFATPYALFTQELSQQTVSIVQQATFSRLSQGVIAWLQVQTLRKEEKHAEKFGACDGLGDPRALVDSAVKQRTSVPSIQSSTHIHTLSVCTRYRSTTLGHIVLVCQRSALIPAHSFLCT